MFSKLTCFQNTSVFKTHLCKKSIWSQKPIYFHVRTISMANHTFDSKEIDFHFTNILKVSTWKARITERNCTSFGWSLRMFNVIAWGAVGYQTFDRWNLLRRNYWVCIFDHIYRFSLIIYFNMWYLLVGHTAILLV